MPKRAIYCPFLNRSDPRCASHFSIDHLNAAFDQCFDQYPTCPAYRELLSERRVRRGETAEPWILRPGERAAADPDRPGASPDPYASPPVQLRITTDGRQRDPAGARA
jgi:hypothetical protein